ncbi:DUF262 and DUF1524 domain-containing protein [Deinococcus soli (ex Cha et al. 2016)]|uniref:Uncharacterized protein with ParB-like and HNH nuclease domain/predicted transport protein n=2 Tax=Deinococcus soli (ex Cha et al. 2016) TaxID=1309411 RepID=A0ACC6KJJ7_9DEIO|nr:DUF262 and DUF1524 domain-containing protein [Deinococcus soli (ex Cha et al. 2016)]MDR6219841.1 uncharacterized protein with ParB-like and HNH nuclease domain/predicted transport protein [Deinococcus soli (ex Cha et al. 2016)]MDR6329901.1 uncharacterized protein with ParB-like and HNH nuclease domain/predicted transport protein [Deinococcus soli (ex Cha et al. 2016)]MDR6752748.1 uncharacterized protein with ParB-like and HNH nuclease domain/predicted transport protein [Deinococcus soli (ex C
MKAEAIPLFKVLQGGRQYEVPIYQRTYSWQREQVERLWEDVLEAGASGRPHFTGSVVYVTTSDDDMADVTEALLIDGQQRLTTTMLFLIALVRRLKETGGFKVERDGSTVSVTGENLRKNLLVNPDVSGRLHHKLVLTQSDRETLARLLDRLDDEHTPLPTKPSPRVMSTLEYFETQLGKSGVDLAQVYAGLQRLQVVRIALKDGEDDPQLIFDSMNSTGLDLSESDRIRNYVLMRMKGDKQEKLYREHWFPMERLFDGDDQKAFDRFIRDFLSLRSKTPIPARLGDVYVAFKRYVEKEHQDIPSLVRELHQAAGYYAALLDPQKHEADTPVRQALLRLRALELDVWYPLVLDAYSAWKSDDLSRDEFVELLDVLEAYLYRRWVCGVGTQGLNKFFPALPGQLRDRPYLQAFKDQLYQQRSYLRFPSDEDFRQQIMIRPMYTPRHLSRYTLGRLENHGHKEPINPDDYTIEHVLPQNKALGKEWREMLGDGWREVQEKYLHTLGNLTLTGYNSEYSDRPFLEKRDLLQGKGKGFKASHLLLNQELAELDGWNEALIQQRAERLADLALQVWPMVQPSEELQEQLSQRLTSSVHSLDDHLQGLPPALRVLVDDLRQQLRDLHAQVQEVPTKKYIAFKVQTNFCDITPQPDLGTVKCWLNLPFSTLDDPQGLARDVSGIGHHGNGEAEVIVSSSTNMDAFLELAQQALNYQLARHQANAAVSEGEGETVDFSRVPSEARDLLEALEQRCGALGAKTRDRRFYRAFHDRRVFMEVRPRQSGLHVSVKLPAERLSADEREGWSVQGAWLNRMVGTAQDLEQAWPGIQRGFEAQLGQEGSSPPSVEEYVTQQPPGVQAIIQAVLETSQDFPTLRMRVNRAVRSFSLDTQAGSTWRPYMEVNPVQDGRVRLYLYTTPGEAEALGLQADIMTHQGFISVFLTSPEDVSRFEPLMEAAYVSRSASGEMVSTQYEIKQLMQDLLDFTTGLDQGIAAEIRGRSVLLTSGGQELARLRKNETAGFVSVSAENTERLYMRRTTDLPAGQAHLQKIWQTFSHGQG